MNNTEKSISISADVMDSNVIGGGSHNSQHIEHHGVSAELFAQYANKYCF
ncbi:MAG: hypothetical protein VSS52_013515 [Thiotrichaceae bacterium]|nr:hypothetical protein [Thiotrichaceae bacterium]MEC4317428.1 hypothetical protein [Thiotrichaceae bacterium]